MAEAAQIETCPACGRLDPWNRGASCYCLLTAGVKQAVRHDDRGEAA
jgi:hypothetical protein